MFCVLGLIIGIECEWEYIVGYNTYQLQSNVGFYTQLYNWLVTPPMPIAGYTIGYNLGTKPFSNSMAATCVMVKVWV